MSVRQSIITAATAAAASRCIRLAKRLTRSFGRGNVQRRYYQLYTWGGGAFGGLGSGGYSDHSQPVKVSAFLPKVPDEHDQVVSISSGWCGNTAVTQNGNAYSWGYKPFIRSLSTTAWFRARMPRLLSRLQSIQLGPISLSNATTRPTRLELPVEVASSANGGDFTVLLGKDGTVWTLGNGFHGQLGHSSYVPETLLKKPKLIAPLVNNNIQITSISAGFAHTCLVSSEGELFVFGKSEHGALGIPVVGSSKRLFGPRIVPGTSESAAGDPTTHPLFHPSYGDSVSQLTHVLATPSPYIGRVKQVSCGMKHTLLLTEDGSVYATGQNTHGELGIPQSFSNSDSFVRIKALKDHKIVRIAAGQHHSVFLAEDGSVFACGINQHGQCGRDGGEINVAKKGSSVCISQPAPMQLRGFLGDRYGQYGQAVNIFAGFYDTVIITDQNVAIICGGHMNKTGRHPPQLLKLDKQTNIHQVSFGLIHACILASSSTDPVQSQRLASTRPDWYNKPPKIGRK